MAAAAILHFGFYLLNILYVGNRDVNHCLHTKFRENTRNSDQVMADKPNLNGRRRHLDFTSGVNLVTWPITDNCWLHYFINVHCESKKRDLYTFARNFGRC